MQIRIRVHTHTIPEIDMGHKLGFLRPHDFNRMGANNVILATADMHGYSKITS